MFPPHVPVRFLYVHQCLELVSVWHYSLVNPSYLLFFVSDIFICFKLRDFASRFRVMYIKLCDASALIKSKLFHVNIFYLSFPLE